MQVIYAKEKFPESFSKSLFLAGPTPRSKKIESWRPEALRILEEMKYDGVVFIPEDRDSGSQVSLSDQNQIDWEDEGLNRADCILFWIPRSIWAIGISTKKDWQTLTMPALTTNIEFGRWEDSSKIVVGIPHNADKVGYIKHYVEKLNVPYSESIEATIRTALGMIGDGALRSGGECQVPFHIWNTSVFQSWYRAQLAIGNRLDGARQLWVYYIGQENKILFSWILQVNVYVAREQRHKANEFIISRSDISTMIMYNRADDIMDAIVVLVREFRSTVSNIDGYVRELPCGSSGGILDSPLAVAIQEVKQEIGLEIDPCRIQIHYPRQVASAFCIYKAHLFSAEITEQELDQLRKNMGKVFGVVKDTERTFIEIRTLREITNDSTIDWSMLGMILSVLTKEFSR